LDLWQAISVFALPLRYDGGMEPKPLNNVPRWAALLSVGFMPLWFVAVLWASWADFQRIVAIAPRGILFLRFGHGMANIRLCAPGGRHAPESPTSKRPTAVKSKNLTDRCNNLRMMGSETS
jgi:hypothetical protein